MTKYQVGQTLLHTGSGIYGTVVSNYKLPGDICVDWDNGLQSSYDADFLDGISTRVETRAL